MFIIFLSHFANAFAESIFQYKRIDFFQKIETQKESAIAQTNTSSEVIQEEWAEPVISPSGKVSIYVPPKEVRDFMDKPNSANAKAYLQWNQKRIKKFILAQELLRKEAKELEVMKETKSLLESDSPAALRDSNDNAKIEVSYLFYFMLKGCPTCEKESRVIEDIYLNHPEVRIEAFAKGFSDRELENFRFSVRQDNGMSSLFKVGSYPGIAIFNKKNKRYFLSGFVDKEKILRLLK
ncbi:MAG: hypothetical protein COT38_02915 [Candidatus Omnitrophica bacterium CG08_land_8_20_14_0_20_41_16]|nr:MAG: hypothetical protein COT38_02915 [Candidatus Omnitrophica bacterium CG08_land_8_20_14_0_20_41_16]